MATPKVKTSARRAPARPLPPAAPQHAPPACPQPAPLPHVRAADGMAELGPHLDSFRLGNAELLPDLLAHLTGLKALEL